MGLTDFIALCVDSGSPGDGPAGVMTFLGKGLAGGLVTLASQLSQEASLEKAFAFSSG